MYRFFTVVILIFILSGCSRETKPLVVMGGEEFIVELAETESARIQGLSNHAALGKNQGMLFLFPEKSVRSFWMKEMNYPLDIIWLDDDKIVTISENLKPEGPNPINNYRASSSINRVLEVNAGTAERLNLKIGDKVLYKL